MVNLLKYYNKTWLQRVPEMIRAILVNVFCFIQSFLNNFFDIEGKNLTLLNSLHV